MKGIGDLKKAILEEKLKQNDYLEKYGDTYKDFYTGFICAMSLVEGFVNEMELLNRSYKCRHCKFISDEQTTGNWHRCNCADKPFRTAHSHLDYKWNHACKYFKKRENGDAV